MSPTQRPRARKKSSAAPANQHRGRGRAEPKRAEQLLRESEARYRQLEARMNEALVAVDKGGRITLVNRQFCRMVGYNKAELVGSRYAMLLDPADRTRVRRQFAGRKLGKQKPYETPFRRKDGGQVLGLVSPKPIFGGRGRFDGSFSVVLDITQRKRAEEALRRNEALFRRLFEANVIGVIAGQDGVIAQANDLFLKMVGYSRRDLKAGLVNWRKMTPRKYKELDRRITQGVLAVGVVTPHEKEYIRKDGSRVPVQVGGALISAEPFRWVCFVRDLTERNKAQAALQMARDKLEQRVARRTSELAMANEGLRREIAERRRVEDSLRDSEERLRAAHAKLVSAREEERRRLALELHDSVGQKLIAAKLKLGSAIAIGIPDDLSDLSRTLKELQEQLSGLSTEVREVSRQLYPQTLEALGLPASLRQLAKDWGSEGPRIEVRCDTDEDHRLAPDVEIALYRIAQEGLTNAIRHARPRRVTVRLSGDREQSRLSIVDDGRGFQVGRAARRGLGLDSMRERAESIGAKFELTSRPGRTCVQVSLPQS